MDTSEESAAAFRMRLLGSAISTYTVCLLVVPLKLWCRSGRNNGGAMRWGWDDAGSFLALIFASVFFFVGIVGMGPQIGRHVGIEVSLSELLLFLKLLFAEQVFYLVCVSCNKFVLLAFYWRLFSVRARIPLLVLMGVVAAWWIGTTIGLVLNCTPIAAQWDATIPDAKCTGPRQLYIGASIPNIITDVILLVTPLPYVWALHAPLAQRLMLAGIFLLGCFITVVSTLRLAILMRVDLASADYTYKMKEVLLWSIVEVNVGLVCACLPSLKPAVRLLGLGRLVHRSRAGPSGAQSPAFGAVDRGSRTRKKGSSSGGRFSSTAGITKLEEEEEDTFHMVSRAHGTVQTSIECGREGAGRKSATHECDGKRPAIVAKRDWSVLIEPQEGHGL